MNQHEVIEFQKIRNVPEVINVTFDFIRQNFRLFAGAVFRFAFPFLAIAVTLSGYWFWGLVDSVSTMGSAPGTEAVMGMVFQAFLVFFVVAVLMTIGATTLIAVVHDVARLYREHGPGNVQMQDVWQGVREKFWMLLFTVFGVGVATTILSVVLAFIPFVGNFGLYILIVFGAFYFPLRIYEGRGFFQSFFVSIGLVQGSWWRTLGLMILFWIMNFAFAAIFVVPIIVAMAVQDFSAIGFESLIDATWFRVLGTVVFSLYYTALALFYSIPLLSLIFHYHSQRERHQSLALLELVENIGQA